MADRLTQAPKSTIAGQGDECVCRGQAPDCPLCGGTGKPVCVACGGTRYVVAVARDGVQSTYTARVCPRCKTQIVPRAPTIYGVSTSDMKIDLDNLDFDYPALRELVQKCKAVVDNRRGWIAAYSGPGTGKSYVLWGSAAYAVRKGLSVYKSTYAELVQRWFSAASDADSLTINALTRVLLTVDLLVIDEFGMLDTIPRCATWIVQMVQQRSEQSDWMPTMLASNLNGQQFRALFPFLYSRLSLRREVFETNLTGVPDLRPSIQ